MHVTRPFLKLDLTLDLTRAEQRKKRENTNNLEYNVHMQQLVQNVNSEGHKCLSPFLYRVDHLKSHPNKISKKPQTSTPHQQDAIRGIQDPIYQKSKSSSHNHSPRRPLGGCTITKIYLSLKEILQQRDSKCGVLTVYLSY